MPGNVANDKNKKKIKEEKFQPLSSKYKKITEKEEAKRAKAEKKRLKELQTKKKINTGGKNAAGETEEESQFDLNKKSKIINIFKRLYLCNISAEKSVVVSEKEEEEEKEDDD